MQELQERKQQLISSLLIDVGKTISLFKVLVINGSDIHNELILLEARLNNTDKERLQGTIKDEDLQLEYNRIRAGVLNLINELEAENLNPNFEAKREQEVLKAPKNRGSILYHIPDIMAVGKESKCVIRIAFDEEILVENFEVTVETEIQSIRVSEVMQVDMIDPSDNIHFNIRTYSSKEQIVDVDAYTEWVYYVKPLQSGTYPLILKVAVIELVRDRERKREIVLEEQVEIITEEIEAEKESISFKTSEHRVQLGTETILPDVPAMKESVELGSSKSIDLPFAEDRSKKRRLPMASILTVMALLVASSWLIIPTFNKEIERKNSNGEDVKGDTGMLKPNDVDFEHRDLKSLPVMDSIFCKGDSNSLGLHLSLTYGMMASSSFYQGDGVHPFYSVLSVLKELCPDLRYPDPQTAKSPNDIAKWYTQHSDLVLVNWTKQSVSELPNGTVLFRIHKSIQREDLSVEYLLEEELIDRVDVYVPGANFPLDTQYLYLATSLAVFA